jgi:hypothetical protein
VLLVASGIARGTAAIVDDGPGGNVRPRAGEAIAMAAGRASPSSMSRVG